MPVAAKPAYVIVTSTQYASEKKAVVAAVAKVEGGETVEKSVPVVMGEDPGEVDVEDQLLRIIPRAKGNLKVEWADHARESGVVRPGRPLVKTIDDVTYHVEAKRIDPNDTRKRAGEKRISPHALRALNAKHDRSAPLRDALNHLRMSRSSVALIKERVSDWAADVDGNEKLIAAATKQQLDRVTGQLAEAEKVFRDEAKKRAPSKKGLDTIRRIARDIDSEAESIIDELHSMSEEAFGIEGRVRITTKLDDNGKIDHWLLRFENEGHQPFIGTAAFTKSNKNAGLGLESMAVPYDGSVAVQRIPFNGNYDGYNGRVRARPGAELRVAVRGMGWTTIKLPESGTASVRVEKFVNDIFSDPGNDEYFEEHDVEEKREEKVEEDAAKVKFYDDGRRWMPDDWEDNRRYR